MRKGMPSEENLGAFFSKSHKEKIIFIQVMEFVEIKD